MGSKANLTLWELWGHQAPLCITIPALQRDYAQGRTHQRPLREAFLQRLHQALNQGQPLQLDFIYGNLRQAEDGTTHLTPIDGQQRLTTLFLLHWYAAWVGTEADFDRFMERARLPDGAAAFCYQTRVSAREFCKALVQPRVREVRPRQQDLDLKAWLHAQTWFYAPWATDPTVSAMLVMLDAIHRHFYACRNGLLERLLDERRLTFAWLDLQDWQLTDDLYLKMNARGKPLTDFENLKAALSHFLKEQHPEAASRIAHKLDRSWSDALWLLSQHNGVDYDTAWMRLLDFWWGCLAQTHPVEASLEQGNFDALLHPLQRADALQCWEQGMDVLAGTVGQGVDQVAAFFEALWDTKTLPLHDQAPDLLARCLKGSAFDRPAEILLFGVWYFLVETQSSHFRVSQSLQDYARLCRNVVWSLEEPRRDDWEVSCPLGVQRSVLRSLLHVFAKKHLYAHLSALNEYNLPPDVPDQLIHEMDKAQLIHAHKSYRLWLHRLEDHPLLRGNLTNFPLEHHLTLQKLKQYVRHFECLWDLEDVSDALRIRALLQQGDHSAYIGNSALGEVWYFGQGRRWARLLRAPSHAFKHCLGGLLQSIVELPVGDLVVVLQQQLHRSPPPDNSLPWRRLMLQYPATLASDTPHVGYIFRSDEPDDYRVEKLLGKSLRSPHINIYVEALAHALNQVEGLTYGRSREPSYLQLSNGLRFQADRGQWLIFGLENDYPVAMQQFGLDQDLRYKNPSMHKLVVPVDADAVGLAVAFLKEVL